MLDQAIKWLSEFQGERVMRQLYLGQAVRLGEDQLPAIWAMQRQCANTLDVAECPKLYVTQHPFGNAMTVGTKEPVTLVLSGLVGGYSEEEPSARCWRTRWATCWRTTSGSPPLSSSCTTH